MRNFLVRSAAAGMALLAVCASAYAYPSQTVRIVVPFAAGGSTDILARSVASMLQQQLGQSIIVENRPGASGNIGAEHVARSAPDGHTLLFTSTNLTMNPAIYKSLGYDAVADFKPVTMVAFAPMVLIAGPKLEAPTVGEMISLARARPGALNYSSSGKGGAPHLAGELLELNQKLNMMHIPYKGAAPALADVAGGQVEMSFTTYISGKSLLEAGKVRALAVASKNRLAALPKVPTFAESGVPDMEIGTMFGLLAPAGVPQTVIDSLFGALSKAADTEAFRAQIEGMGGEVVLNSPTEYATYVREDVAKWKALINRIGGVE